LGHVTRKTVSEMTYNVSSGTLNSTIPYHTAGNSSFDAYLVGTDWGSTKGETIDAFTVRKNL